MTPLSETLIRKELMDLQRNPNFDFRKINLALFQEALILITNTKGEIIYLNHRCSNLLGYNSEELVGKHTRIFNTGLHSRDFYKNLWDTLLSGNVWKGEITAKRKNGSLRWFFMLIVPLLDQNDHPYQFLTIRFDITDQKDLEKRILLKDKQLHSFLTLLSDSVVGMIDSRGKITYLSPTAEKRLGYKAFVEGEIDIYDHIAQQSHSHFRRFMDELMKVPDGCNTIELMLENKDGSPILCELNAKNYLHDPVLRSIVFTYRDITKRKKFEEEFNQLVQYDELTGLPNSRSFENRLDKEIEEAKEKSEIFAVVLMNVDDFKYVNNTLGYQVGNELLQSFADKINHLIPENFSMYRLNGDLFSFLMTDLSSVDDVSVPLSSCISRLNREPFQIGEHEIYISASIGVSDFPYSGENKGDLLKNAGTALHQAKKKGGNQFQFYSSTMSLHDFKQFTLRNDSKHALLNNEFDVYFQPRVHPVTNKIVSSEALIRWSHPKWGLVLPNEFISMAEESGLIIAIGEWVIRKVCADIKQMSTEDLPAKKISINISSLQLLQPNFVEMVSTILKEVEVDSKWIEFEITESVIIDQEDEVLATITRLKDLGITIALDDFGTGYSSLNYLKKFPCDVIKIDKSLIQDIDKDRENYEIAGTIISLCHRLKKEVVAEGVETEEQLATLRNFGVDEIQGYLYSRPVNLEDYKRLLRDGIHREVEKTNVQPYKNKRKYFRVPFDHPLVADMTIVKIGDRVIQLGSTEVMIKDISAGGLSFYSTLKLPISKEITLQFTSEILTEKLRLKGNVVWFKETENNYNQYGIEFTIANGEQEKLIKTLNGLQLKLKQKSKTSGNRLYRN